MQIRVITLRYNEAVQGFPEDALKSAIFVLLRRTARMRNRADYLLINAEKNVPSVFSVLSIQRA